MAVEKLIRTIDGQVFTLTPITTVLQTEVPVTTSSAVLTTLTTDPLASVAVSYNSLIASTTSISSTHSTSSASTSTSTTSDSFNLGSTANTGGVDDTPSISSKTGLIVGLSVGIPVFLFVFLTVIWYYKLRNRPFLFKKDTTFKESKWKNSNFKWDNDDDDYMMTKNFKVMKNVTTPVAAASKDNVFMNGHTGRSKFIRKSGSVRGINNWRAHIFTPFKNSFISETKEDKSSFDVDLEKNDEVHYSDEYDGSSDKSKNISSSSNDDFDAEKFLYTNPPKIRNISSEISSFKSTEKTKPKKYNDLNLDNIADTQSIHEKWTYTSPLSKWFLRDSTYLQDSHITTPTDQILSVDLKTLQLPSKEKSITKPTTKVNLNTKRKHIIDINGMKRLSAIMHIKEKPLPKPPSLEEKRVSRLSVLTGSFQKASNETKKAQYRAVQAYTPQMLDELELVKGQVVKIISVHSDGWALVTLNNGDTLRSGDLEHVAENEMTGVVPLICLQKI